MSRTRITTSVGVSRIRAGEPDWLVTPDLPASRADEYPVICLHPTGAGAFMSYVNANTYAQATLPGRLAVNGISSMGGWMGGDNFANDVGVAAVEATRVYLDGLDNVDASKVHLVGVSQGGALEFRYAGLNPARVASITGIIPLADTQAVYAADRLSLRTPIATAWGVTYPTALPATANAITHAPAIASAGIPTRIYASPSDAAILPAEVEALADALGIDPIWVDGTTIPGHSEQTVLAAANRDGADLWSDLISWMRAAA